MSLSGTHSKLANLGKTEQDEEDEDNNPKDHIQWTYYKYEGQKIWGNAS